MPDDLSIRKILEQVGNGNIRIPAFQRGFVWDAEKVAYFMDSLFKGYPFGSLLFWRTKAQLKTERQLGPFVLPDRNPEYPIDYVLDGQQRITSIFGVFQTDLKAQKEQDWTSVYFDFRADPTAQQSQFMVLDLAEVDPSRHFSLNVLFDVVGYRSATSSLAEELLDRVDDLQARFKEVRIPVQTFSTEDRATVAIVFERVNRKGVELDTLQLLSAWTWSDEFDLQQEFKNLSAELQPFGFADVGEDTNLLLRCCAAVLRGEASPNTLVELEGARVREKFGDIVNGIKGAIDFLRRNLEVQSVNNLPFLPLLVPLSVFFAVPENQTVRITDDQRSHLVRWFWRSCFSRRYSSGVLRNLKTDIDEMQKLRDGQQTKLDALHATIGPDFFVENVFRIDSVNTKTFVLMLANRRPLSFVSGSPINLENVLRDYNRNEFHHLYPRAYLRELQEGIHPPKNDMNCLANFCFMSRADNGTLGGVAPSLYKAKMPSDQQLADVLERALCPYSLFDDNFDEFIGARAARLAQEATQLVE
jgi:hypothetical protein